MNLLQLEYFIVVAQQEHFTRASEILNITQPALSIMISRLEKDLGCQLFNRTGRNVKLNNQGKLFYDYINEGLLLIKSGEKAIKIGSLNLTNEITIVGTSTIILHNIIREFIKCNSIKINMHKIMRSQVYNYLDNPHIDLVLSPEPIIDKKYESVLLYEEELFLVVNQNHPFANLKSINLADAKSEKFFFVPQGYSLRTDCEYLCELAGFEPKIIMECDFNLRVHMVSQNLGVTFASQLTYGNNIFPHNVRFIKIIIPLYKRKMFLSYHKKQYLSEPVKKFKNYIIKYCKTKLDFLD